MFVFRLPTEAEWEYACGAGTKTAFECGESISTQQANVMPNVNVAATTPGNLMEVGMFKPNAWGLFDMHGNANEWCYDWFESYAVSSKKSINPCGPAEGTLRVYRGGDFTVPTIRCQCAKREHTGPLEVTSKRGLRVVLGPSIENLHATHPKWRHPPNLKARQYSLPGRM